MKVCQRWHDHSKIYVNIIYKMFAYDSMESHTKSEVDRDIYTLIVKKKKIIKK